MLKAPVPLNNAFSAQTQGIKNNSGTVNISMPGQWEISEHAMGVVPSVDFDERRVMNAIDAVRAAEIAMFNPESPQPLDGMSVEEELQYPIDPAFKHRTNDFAFKAAILYEQQFQKHVSDFDNDPNSLAEFKRRWGRMRETGLERASVLQVKNNSDENAQQRMAGIENLNTSLKQFSGDLDRLSDGLAEIESWHHALPTFMPGDEPVEKQIARTQEELIRTVFEDQVANRNARGAELLLSRVGNKLSPDTRQELETRSQALSKVVRQDNLYEGIIQLYDGNHGRALKALDDSEYPGKYDDVSNEDLGYIKARLEADVAEKDRQRREAVLAKQDRIHGTLLKLAMEGKLDTWTIRNSGLSNDEQQEMFEVKRAMDEREIREKSGDLYQQDADKETMIEAALIFKRNTNSLAVHDLTQALGVLSKSKINYWREELIKSRESNEAEQGGMANRYTGIVRQAREVWPYWPEMVDEYVVELENILKEKNVSPNSSEAAQIARQLLLDTMPSGYEIKTLSDALPPARPAALFNSGLSRELVQEFLDIPEVVKRSLKGYLEEQGKPVTARNVVFMERWLKEEGAGGNIDVSNFGSFKPELLPDQEENRYFLGEYNQDVDRQRDRTRLFAKDVINSIFNFSNELVKSFFYNLLDSGESFGYTIKAQGFNIETLLGGVRERIGNLKKLDEGKLRNEIDRDLASMTGWLANPRNITLTTTARPDDIESNEFPNPVNALSKMEKILVNSAILGLVQMDLDGLDGAVKEYPTLVTEVIKGTGDNVAGFFRSILDDHPELLPPAVTAPQSADPEAFFPALARMTGAIIASEVPQFLAGKAVSAITKVPGSQFAGEYLESFSLLCGDSFKRLVKGGMPEPEAAEISSYVALVVAIGDVADQSRVAWNPTAKTSIAKMLEKEFIESPDLKSRFREAFAQLYPISIFSQLNERILELSEEEKRRLEKSNDSELSKSDIEINRRFLPVH